MDITGVSHVALTVPDLDRSKQWYASVLGWQQLMDGDDGGIRFAFGFIGSGVGLGLRQHGAAGGDGFSPDRVGLDHVSFAVGTRDELVAWERTFDEHDVSYTPTIDAPYGHVLNFKDPDGLALELFALPAGLADLG